MLVYSFLFDYRIFVILFSLVQTDENDVDVASWKCVSIYTVIFSYCLAFQVKNKSVFGHMNILAF